MKLLVATANEHKLQEYRQLLADLDVELLSLPDVGIEELPEETGETYEANALIKARSACSRSGLLTLADDSGLEVAALGGEPGVRSSRWAGPDKSDADRVTLLLRRLEGMPDEERDARFVCVVAVVGPDRAEATFRGELPGRLVREPVGESGFGYDPIFFVESMGRTVGQLSADEKHRISHRARAVQAAKPWLQAYLDRGATVRGRA